MTSMKMFVCNCKGCGLYTYI